MGTYSREAYQQFEALAWGLIEGGSNSRVYGKHVFYIRNKLPAFSLHVSPIPASTLDPTSNTPDNHRLDDGLLPNKKFLATTDF